MAVNTPHDDTTRVPADDKFRDECGVFGVWKVPDAAAVTALGLHALQHRGQESTGIVSFDGKHFHSHRRNCRPPGPARDASGSAGRRS